MKMALDDEVENLLEGQGRAGVCPEPGEFADALVRSVRERQQKAFEVTPELEAWLLEAADRPSTPLTKADFAALRERVKVRLPAVRPSVMETWVS